MSPVPHRLPLVVAVAALLLAVAGCSESAGPTQEQYASMADGVCESILEKITELEEAHDAETWEAAATGESNLNVERPERWMRAKIIPQYERMSGNLKGLQPPEGDFAYLSDLYADLDQRIEELHLQPSAGRLLIDGDAQLRDRFQGYGIEKCPPPLPVDEAAEPPAAEGAVEGAEGQGQ